MTVFFVVVVQVVVLKTAAVTTEVDGLEKRPLLLFALAAAFAGAAEAEAKLMAAAAREPFEFRAVSVTSVSEWYI